MKHLRIYILLFLAAAFLPAQDIEPEEPGIVLPPAFLAVEDLQVENVEAALPDDEIQLRPDIAIPLPEADELYLPEEVFDIPYPDQVLAAQQTTSPLIFTGPQSQRSSIFSEGQIGVGSMNHVIGDISLFKLGMTPRFNLRFYHEKKDGYLSGGGFLYHDAGSGFYHSDDVLNGAFSFAGGNFNLDAEGEIAEVSDGLQGRSSYDSLTHRFMSADINLGFFPLDTLTLSGGLRAHNVNKTLSATAPETPVNRFEFSVRPEAAIQLSLPVFGTGLQAMYEFLDYAAPAPSAHKMNARANISLSLQPEYKILLLGGVSWTIGGSPLFPVSLSFEGAIGNVFLFSIAGGYKVEDIRFYPMWKKSPLLDATLPVADNGGWFGEARAQYRPARSVLLDAGIDFSAMSAVVDPQSSHDTGTGLFAFSQSALMTLKTVLGISWDISQNFRLETDWTGRFIELAQFTPSHSLSLSFEGQDNLERFGGSLAASMDVYLSSGVEIPALTINGFYRITEGVMFELDAEDLLSPLYAAGRPYWGGYVDAGLHVTLTTRISL